MQWQPMLSKESLPFLRQVVAQEKDPVLCSVKARLNTNELGYNVSTHTNIQLRLGFLFSLFLLVSFLRLP